MVELLLIASHLPQRGPGQAPLSLPREAVQTKTAFDKLPSVSNAGQYLCLSAIPHLIRFDTTEALLRYTVAVNRDIPTASQFGSGNALIDNNPVTML